MQYIKLHSQYRTPQIRSFTGLLTAAWIPLDLKTRKMLVGSQKENAPDRYPVEWLYTLNKVDQRGGGKL